MKHIARRQTAATLALAAALAMPLALAQSAVPQEVRETQQAAAEAAARDAANAATPVQDVDDSGWAQLDADGNGTLSREEAAAVPALQAAFDAADADGSGELTREEYRAHVADDEG